MPEATPFSGLTDSSRAVELVKARYRVAEKAQSNQMNRYDTWFRMFKGERVRKNYEGLSNITVPKVFEKVERGTAVLAQAIKKVKVTAQGKTDKQNAINAEQLIDYENRTLEIARIRKLWIKSARIHGQAYLKVTWNVSKETPEQPTRGLEISLPDPKSIFFNPDYTPEQKFRWAIHELNIPFSKLKANKKFNKTVLADVKRTSTLGNKAKAQNNPNRTLNPNQPDITDETTLMTNIKEYYGLYADSDEKDEEQYVITLANDEYILSKEKSKYAEILDDPIPIIPLSLYDVPHEAHAMGDAEVIESLYTELNDTRNQRLDTVTLNIDPLKIILKAAQIDEKELIAKKGWVVHSNLPNGITVIPPDMQGVMAAINEEKIIQGDIDRTLGIASFGADTPVSGDVTTDTATGVNALMQAQDIMSNSVLDNVKSALTKFYQAILAYNQTFIDREFVITLLETKQGQENQSVLSPERIRGKMDLDIEIELVSNKLMRRAEALQALNVGSKIPGTNMGKLWEDYLRTHDKYDFEEYYTPPQPAPPEQPKVSVSLRGEMNQLQASQVYKTITGVNAKFADPLMIEEAREMMRGNLPENIKREKEQAEIMKFKAEAVNELQNAGSPRNQTNES